ncbi:dTDP-4-amino-4,6-dideoxygalactose transaminase [Hyphomicrobium sp.]|uniref:dTDP-4-amino-4,6-dideoxygalactose transaminase n=1 Tax=Hyphomicrobium sp. TaxID=82 RepID=UPI002E30131A|nr:dTDP-4-amino-4,6-dideoxygalactose transaminase [Hyphomicrobium sp.]HEX2841191.1 dTDP-4-amino-4,6-dideoxygalactose transaminase [Hyphomicrobium sp.]
MGIDDKPDLVRTSDRIAFNKPAVVGRELDYIRQALENGKLAGDGAFTRDCHTFLGKRLAPAKALLTHSCTAALEMACILADIGPGDEVILPSYTFVSTANAVVLRGGIPVFVDIRPDTLNIDENLIDDAITPRTKAIIAVHYAGVVAEMDAIDEIAKRRGLVVIEDAAQAYLSIYKGRQAGTLSDMACFSFHETKNIVSGEGGAFVTRDKALFDRAEIVREKGTNRRQFLDGIVDKYSWVDVGSSYLPSELIAAFLKAQLEEAEAVTAKRLAIWNTYAAGFAKLEQAGLVARPSVPLHCTHNGHMFYLLLGRSVARGDVVKKLDGRGVQAVSHYVPLHSSVAGTKFGRVGSAMTVTDDIHARLLRLPLHQGLKSDEVDAVVDALNDVIR